MAINSSTFYTLFIGICLTAAALIIYVKRSRRLALARKHGCRAWGPSYNHIDPLFGLDFIYENACNIRNHRFAQGVRERFQRYGTTHYSRMGFQDIVNTVDPANLQQIMQIKINDYSIIPHRQKLVSLIWGDGIFTNDGAAWGHSKKMASHGLGNLSLDYNTIEAHTQSMIDRVLSASSSTRGGMVDFNRIVTEFNFNLVTSFFFGDLPCRHVNQTRQFAEDFALLIQMGAALTIFISTSQSLGDILYRKRFRPAQQRLFNFVDTCAERALQTTEKDERRKHRTIVEGLATETHDIKEIRSEALNLLLAGHDTVRIFIAELFWYFARHTDAWNSLRAEVFAKLNGRLPTRADLKDMTYLNWCIKEFSRLTPTLSSHGRRAIRDTVLPHGGGPSGTEKLLIPKGTYVAYSHYTLHRDPAVFGADVDSFRPERWKDIKELSRWQYLPFGAGPRTCVGKEMGWSIVAYAAVRLAQEIESLVVPPEEDLPWEEAASFAFYNRNGVHFGVVPAGKGEGVGEKIGESEGILVDVGAQC